MTSFTIADSDLEGIKDQVVIVTGASSGIGLATVKRLLSHGAKVYASDMNDLPEPEKSTVPFMKVDVVSWKQQLAMFKAAVEKYGKIDHVFANAGIKPTATLLEEEVDENGDLLPPRLDTINVNLLGCMYTVKLGIHYLKQNPNGGSIVVTGSGSSFSRFSPTDYTSSKHAVLGLVRALYTSLHPRIPIRINAIAPSWTNTGIVPKALIDFLGEGAVQTADVVARSVIYLFASQKGEGGDKCHGECIYSDKGKFWDIENGPRGLNAYSENMLGDDYVAEEVGLDKLRAAAGAKTGEVGTGKGFVQVIKSAVGLGKEESEEKEDKVEGKVEQT